MLGLLSLVAAGVALSAPASTVSARLAELRNRLELGEAKVETDLRGVFLATWRAHPKVNVLDQSLLAIALYLASGIHTPPTWTFGLLGGAILPPPGPTEIPVRHARWVLETVLAENRAIGGDDESLWVDVTIGGMLRPVLDWANATSIDLGSLSFAEATVRAARWHETLGEGVARPVSAGKTNVVHRWSDGWSLVQLLDAAALDAETAALGHCIGTGPYDDRVISPHWVYASLRDAAGQPKTTLEFYRSEASDGRLSPRIGWEPTQVRGRKNHLPIESTEALRALRWVSAPSSEWGVDALCLLPDSILDRLYLSIVGHEEGDWSSARQVEAAMVERMLSKWAPPRLLQPSLDVFPGGLGTVPVRVLMGSNSPYDPGHFNLEQMGFVHATFDWTIEGRKGPWTWLKIGAHCEADVFRDRGGSDNFEVFDASVRVSRDPDRLAALFSGFASDVVSMVDGTDGSTIKDVGLFGLTVVFSAGTDLSSAAVQLAKLWTERTKREMKGLLT